jgi:hypothetical protein
MNEEEKNRAFMPVMCVINEIELFSGEMNNSYGLLLFNEITEEDYLANAQELVELAKNHLSRLEILIQYLKDNK